MIDIRFAIVEAFSQEYRRELTINQLSKLLKRPYASVNAAAHDLIRRGVLKEKKVGNALLCSLDYACDEAIAILTYNAILKRTGYLHGLTEKQREQVLRKAEESFLAYEDTKLKTLKQGDIRQFDAAHVDYMKLVILRNAEEFWRLVAR